MYKKIFVILLVFITAFAGILWAEKSPKILTGQRERMQSIHLS